MTARSLASVLLGLALLSTIAAHPAAAAVSRVTVQSRQDVLGGRSFGPVGGYEKLTGVVEFALDPDHPANAAIVHLRRAPRDAAGRVVATANFMVLRPKTVPRERGIALLEVSNRGGKAALPYFARAAWSRDPTADAEFGDALPLRLGLTLIWVGWQFDVPPGSGLLRLDAPVATEGGRPIEGLVRSDWTVDERTTTLALGHRDHRPYPLADADHPDTVLTERDGRLAPRRVLPRDQWRFVDGDTRITRERGFEPGKIYELVYRARDPVVVGLGLAAVRDMMSYAKYDAASLFPVHAGIGLGISQTGRFLRHFVYQGFNTDEARRQVFDGLFVHTAGAGRGSFNHRFAQPSRDAHRFSAFLYPTDLFPFSGKSQRDPETGATDGLFAHEPHLPKIFFTNTGYEYWARAASLIHTSPDGRADVAPLPNERIYHFAGGQHFIGWFPPSAGGQDGEAYRTNPLDFLFMLRALLVRLTEWVVDDRVPPPSAYPTLAAGTLVPIDALKRPVIPNLTVPSVIHEAYRVDYGPRWASGIITREPPGVGAAFPVRVSQVDADGNEIAGVRGVELLAPLATYLPWQLRGGQGSDAGELVDFLGTYVPLPRTEAERQRRGDARVSIERRYADKRAYLTAAEQAADSLAAAGLLLREDVRRVVERAEQHWDWITSR